jgi:hypothetical protein
VVSLVDFMAFMDNSTMKWQCLKLSAVSSSLSSSHVSGNVCKILLDLKRPSCVKEPFLQIELCLHNLKCILWCGVCRLVITVHACHMQFLCLSPTPPPKFNNLWIFSILWLGSAPTVSTCVFHHHFSCWCRISDKEESMLSVCLEEMSHFNTLI